jgi:DNA-binding transcriptional ArsR family regulator
MAVAAASETVFTAIASETRRKLLDALRDTERTVSDLVGIAKVSQPAVSQHLRVLKDVGLVDERAEGRFRFYRLKPKPLAEVMKWVRAYERFWTERLAALGRVLDEET